MQFRRLLHVACARLWFDRITVLGAEHLPEWGPILYVGLHRNGLVDGFVHQVALRRPTFMISSQWRKSVFRRLFFDGIVVTRDKDEGDASANIAAMDRCLAHLRAGGELDIFPEGTSALGPRRLPLKTGAARILAAHLAGGGPITVLPVALHYERAWAFRSRVEVVLGPPLDTSLPEGLPPHRRMRALQQRIEAALDEVGANFPDALAQAIAESLAYAATLGTAIPYSRALKVLERGIPGDLRRDFESFAPSRAWRHQGVPLIPTGSPFLYGFLLALLAPLVATAVALNLPPFLAAWWAGRALPDDRNVVALWRILVGVPAGFLWSLAVVSTALILGHPAWILGWAALSAAGVKGWYRMKKLAVASRNAWHTGNNFPRGPWVPMNPPPSPPAMHGRASPAAPASPKVRSSSCARPRISPPFPKARCWWPAPPIPPGRPSSTTPRP